MLRVKVSFWQGTALFLCLFASHGFSLPVANLEACRAELKATHGFDVIKAWIEGGAVSREQALALPKTHYHLEALSIARTLAWLEGNAQLTKAIFKELKAALEGPEEYRSVKEARYRQALIALKAAHADVPTYVWEFIEEWKGQTAYPFAGLPPTRNEFIRRIRGIAMGASTDEKMQFLSLLQECKLLKLEIFKPARGALNLTELMIRWERKSRVIERFLQSMVIQVDRSLAALPSDSYPPAPNWVMRRVQDMARLFLADSDRGTYFDSAFFSRYLNFLNRMLHNRRWHGIDLNGHPLAKRLFFRAISEGLVGTMPSLPKTANLVDEFRLFLRQQISVMATQAQLELPLEYETEEPAPENTVNLTAEVAADPDADTAPDFDLGAVTLSNDFPSTPSVPPAFLDPTPIPIFSDPQVLASPDAQLDVALTTAVAEVGTITENVVRRRRVKPPKPAPHDVAEVEFERGLPRLEIPREDIIRLMLEFTPTDWHAKLIRKQVAGLQRSTSEAAFDRIMQSIAVVLTAIKQSERAQDADHGRHMKNLSQKGLCEIKPQGRTPVRVIFGLGPGGYHLLRILPRSKNSARRTVQQLNDLADEYAALK